LVPGRAGEVIEQATSQPVNKLGIEIAVTSARGTSQPSTTDAARSAVVGVCVEVDTLIAATVVVYASTDTRSIRAASQARLAIVGLRVA
jgi:hypothetical protein